MADRRCTLFRDLLNERVLIFDGAMGTSIHALDLPLSDYRGLENCSEILNLSRPDAIEQIHRGFFEVGCDVVETNTFGGMKHVLAEFDLAGQTHEINVAAAQIARRAADALSTPTQPRFVAGSMGPGTKLVSLRQISYDELFDSYYAQACGLLAGGVDVMVIETCQDILQSKCVIHAVRMAFEKIGRRTPLMVSVTMETTGTMLVGTDIAGALTAIEAYPEVDVIGLNCATGPQEMSEHIRHLSRNCTRKLSVMPNAGLPQVVNGAAHFPLSPADLAHWLKEFVVADGVNIVGGCCGTTARHLKAVVDELGRLKAEGQWLKEKSRRPSEDAAADTTKQDASGSDPAFGPRLSTFDLQSSAFPSSEPAISSLYQSVPMRQDNSFLIVGERCNTNGSKKFKEMLAGGDLDGCVHLAIEQVKEEGAHVLDVCVDYVGRAGVPDMQRVIDRFSREVTAPLMLDSTQVDVIEAGLKLAGGKCIVNSVNLEDGEEKLAKVAGLCRKYGAAVVALTIDEDPVEAMAKTADRKVEIATRIRNLLVDRHGMREEDIFWDCLTFPITTGNEADRRLALETLDGIERVMKKFPRCQSILGLSNVSFGLVPAARVVLNSVFLHEARQRGLTAAIVHAGKIMPRSQISDERWNAALDLIYDRRNGAQPPSAGSSILYTESQPGAAVLQSQPQSQPEAAVFQDPLERFIGLFSADEKVGQKAKIADLPIEERLKRRIVDGNRTGLEADLDEAMKKYPPLEIINTLLLDGMKTVGELFGSGQMQLPFVLKSAETMKSAVAHLEPHMDRIDGQSRGKIVLATVRGDVHDIGKNLVDIILTNNGYKVYNLGIKQPINNVIAAWREHNADAIGLSGLLVKSTLVMRDDLAVLNEHGISAPVILGGAALTRKYVEDDLRNVYDGALFYARDAFDGLSLMADVCEGRAPKSTHGAQPPSAVISGTQPPSAVPVPPPATAITGSDAKKTAAGGGVPKDTAEGGCAPRIKGGDAATLEAADRNLAKLESEIEQRYGLREIDDFTSETTVATGAQPPSAVTSGLTSGAQPPPAVPLPSPFAPTNVSDLKNTAVGGGVPKDTAVGGYPPVTAGGGCAPDINPAGAMHRRNLPHIEPGFRPVFVTFCTRDRWELPPAARDLVLKHCLHDHGSKIDLIGVMVMPDHVHLVFTPGADSAGEPYSLSKIMNGIKGASAHSINKLLGRKGAVWQEESFDRIIRSDESVTQKTEYICENPVRKRLVASVEEYPWKWRAWVEGVGFARAGVGDSMQRSQPRAGVREESQPRAGVREESQPRAGVREESQPRAAVLHGSDIGHDHEIPAPPFWGARVVEKIPLKAALAFVNETMLFQVQWGFRKKGRSPEEWKQHVNAEIRPIYRELVERCERENVLQCAAVYGYWPCASDGDDLVIYEPPTGDAAGNVGTWAGGKGDASANPALSHPPTFPPSHAPRELCRLSFPRQKKPPFWCLSDFWRPLDQSKIQVPKSKIDSRGSGFQPVSRGSGFQPDVVAFHIVTAGRKVSDVAREWFSTNQYQQYLFLHGLGVETAEALAEYMHKQIRSELGIAGHDARELQMLFKQGYRGSRFSFGYPACPRLEDQRVIMQLLKPERIGIELSEEFQLEPEQSTSAIIAHHPAARYFNVR